MYKEIALPPKNKEAVEPRTKQSMSSIPSFTVFLVTDNPEKTNTNT